jgi:hypothetical protein
VRDAQIDSAALALTVREVALFVARAVLAVRRGDRVAAEAHLVGAQRALVLIERGLPRQTELR